MNFFWAEIVDVENDDEKSGRAKIRIMGDQTELKDSELRYARPLFPVTSASKELVQLQLIKKVHVFLVCLLITINRYHIF
jgi:hypothetical protein